MCISRTVRIRRFRESVLRQKREKSLDFLGRMELENQRRCVFLQAIWRQVAELFKFKGKRYDLTPWRPKSTLAILPRTTRCIWKCMSKSFFLFYATSMVFRQANEKNVSRHVLKLSDCKKCNTRKSVLYPKDIASVWDWHKLFCMTPLC